MPRSASRLQHESPPSTWPSTLQLGRSGGLRAASAHYTGHRPFQSAAKFSSGPKASSLQRSGSSSFEGENPVQDDDRHLPWPPRPSPWQSLTSAGWHEGRPTRAQSSSEADSEVAVGKNALRALFCPQASTPDPSARKKEHAWRLFRLHPTTVWSASFRKTIQEPIRTEMWSGRKPIARGKRMHASSWTPEYAM